MTEINILTTLRRGALLRVLVLRFGGQCAAALNVLAQQPVQRGAQRHAQHHADHAVHMTADHHRGQHPYAGQSQRRADHARVDEIALDLLEHHDIDEEQQRLEGIDREDHERAHKRADIRAGDGDERRKADQRAHHDGVWEAEDQHPQRAERAQYQRLETLADDIAAGAYSLVILLIVRWLT